MTSDVHRLHQAFDEAELRADIVALQEVDGPQAARLIAAGETTEAELSVVAPDGDAVGYTLDICLRQEASRVRCAHGDG